MNLELVKHNYPFNIKKGEAFLCMISEKEVNGSYASNSFSKGKIYIVREDKTIYHSTDSITVELDDKNSRNNGWNARFFKKLPKHYNLKMIKALYG